MALGNDSITVTPGSGATVATQLADGKEMQVVAPADAAGHLHGSKATYLVSTGNTSHVAASRTTMLDLFNASGSGVTLTVVGCYVIPALVAVSGVGVTYEVLRTTTVGTGGTALTLDKYDPDSPDVPAQVTARLKRSGGAAGTKALLYINGSSEETTPYAGLASTLNHIPQPMDLSAMRGLKVPEGSGLKIDQTTNSSTGNVNFLFVFTVE
jgi:hypothetical protein